MVSTTRAPNIFAVFVGTRECLAFLIESPASWNVVGGCDFISQGWFRPSRKHGNNFHVTGDCGEPLTRSTTIVCGAIATCGLVFAISTSVLAAKRDTILYAF